MLGRVDSGVCELFDVRVDNAMSESLHILTGLSRRGALPDSRGRIEVPVLNLGFGTDNAAERRR